MNVVLSIGHIRYYIPLTTACAVVEALHSAVSVDRDYGSNGYKRTEPKDIPGLEIAILPEQKCLELELMESMEV